jgi:hypothetical protein
VSLLLPPKLPADVVEKIQRLAPYPDECAQIFFRIKNKQGVVVPFQYNRPQRLHAERSTRFDYALKARKMGISSRRIARDLWACATMKDQHRILLTQTDDDAFKMLNERVKPLHDNCLFPLGGVFRADHYFFPLTRSRYYVHTAGAKKYGRGSDITGGHATEYAHWEKPEVWDGVEEALVDNADLLIETTANGYNFAKEDWENAKRQRNQYRAIFLPWYADEDYVADATGLTALDQEEQRLVEAFGLTREQLAWRRGKLASMRRPELFPQEYPATDAEAFLSSGRPVFDWVALLRHEARVAEPKWVGDLVDKGNRLEFEPNPRGFLKVWKMPERRHVYVVGSDVAEGVKGGAYSTGEVLDVGDSEQVAEWHGHIAPDLLSEELDKLGRWYNFALTAPEAWPGPGETTTSHLEKTQKYANLWRDEDHDRYGWTTNAATKPRAVREFNSALRDLLVAIRSRDLLDELRGYIFNEKGEMVPSLGGFSDRLMGMVIAWAVSRDLAAKTDYYRVEAPQLEGLRRALGGGSTSVPRASGPRPGRRAE